MSSPVHKRNSNDGYDEEPKSYEMGLQISCGFHPEMPPEDALCGSAALSGKSVSRPCVPEVKPDRRRALDAGSCAYDDFDPAEICCVAGSGIYQGQVCRTILRRDGRMMLVPVPGDVDAPGQPYPLMRQCRPMDIIFGAPASPSA